MSNPPDAEHSARSGVIVVATSFFLWGLLPLYLKPLHALPALHIAAWRYLMGCVTVMCWVSWRGQLAQVRQALSNILLLRRLAITASLLAINWTLYAWGIGHGQVLISSLGYFINPLVNVLLGVLILSERLNRMQWLAVALAAAAVVGLTINAGHPPWLALALAVTFSLYGLLRKITPVAALPGLAVETLLVAPLAAVYLFLFSPAQQPVDFSPLVLTLIACSGIATIVPLALFNYGARKIDYATVGMLQYIAPTLQFLIGIFIYQETLTPARLSYFGLIWMALLIYAGDALWRNHTLKRQLT